MIGGAPGAAAAAADGGEAAAAAGGAVSFPVVERFVSVNGEGLAAGRPAAFIRFAGCNLRCDYCDTAWASESDAPVEPLAALELLQWVCGTGVSAVTLTGGEPLLQPHLGDLVQLLLAVRDPWPLRVEVETNGSCDLAPLAALRERATADGLPGSLHLTVDWKMPVAGAEAAGAMMEGNYRLLDGRDAVKFVVGSADDVALAGRCADGAGLWDRCTVLLSPVWGSIQPAELVQAMEDCGLHRARLQLQLHKIIWPGEAKGV